jgi:hypothetical protein
MGLEPAFIKRKGLEAGGARLGGLLCPQNLSRACRARPELKMTQGCLWLFARLWRDLWRSWHGLRGWRDRHSAGGGAGKARPRNGISSRKLTCSRFRGAS